METPIQSIDLQTAVTHLFDEDIHLTDIVEYGLSYQDLVSGKAVPPPQGARFDLYFEGDLYGADITGRVKGVDYLEVRPDGKFQITIYATITTDDGARIALHETGQMTPDAPGSAQLHLTMQFSTADRKYAWLNQKQVWGAGVADTRERTVRIRGYAN